MYKQAQGKLDTSLKDTRQMDKNVGYIYSQLKEGLKYRS